MTFLCLLAFSAPSLPQHLIKMDVVESNWKLHKRSHFFSSLNQAALMTATLLQLPHWPVKLVGQNNSHEKATSDLFRGSYSLRTSSLHKTPNVPQLLSATGPRMNTFREQHGDATWGTTSFPCQHFVFGFPIRLFLLDVCNYSVASPNAMPSNPHNHSSDYAHC